VVRWHYGFYPTTLLEHAIAATLIAFAVETIRAGRPLPTKWGGPGWGWGIPVALFVVAGALDVVFAPSRTAALGLYRAYIIEPIAFAFVLVNVLTTARRALAVLAGLGVAGIWVGAPNIVVVLQALREHTYNVTQTPPVVIYTTANALALFLGPLIAVAAAMLLHERDRNIRAGAAVFLIVAAPAMLLTFSRGGFLAMAVVAVGLALSHPRRWWLLVGVAVAGALIGAIPPVFHRITLEFQNVEGSTFIGRDGRIELWKAALTMLRANPIFGAGLSGYAEKVAPYWNADHSDALFIDPHNIVLNFWSETGLLGLISFAWIMVKGFRTTWRGWHETWPAWKPIELGILLALVAMVVHGLVDVPYFKNDLSLEFWALIAIAVAGLLYGGLKSAPLKEREMAEPAPV